MANRQSDSKFFFTIDVDWVPGSQTGVLQTLDFCEERKLAATLFVTGRFAAEYPEIIHEAAERGFELGSHGWEHGQLERDEDEDFRSATYEQQKQWMEKSTEAVEKASGVRPVAFRAPNLWVNETTLRVLEELNYKYDSSVPARRLTVGYSQLNSRRNFFAPRDPYHPSPNCIALPGNSQILEIPPSTFVIPINMSALRVLGLKVVKWAVRRILKRSSTLVFYSHPAEFVLPEGQSLPSSNPKRHLEGLGPANFKLLAEFVDYVINLGYSPTMFSEIDYESSNRDD